MILGRFMHSGSDEMQDNGWIKCEDEMPDEHDIVLGGGVPFGADDWQYAPLVVNRGGKLKRAFPDSKRTASSYFTTITHWKKLPEPPENN